MLDIIFPPHCVNCNAADHWLCPNCLNQVSLIVSSFCSQCGIPTTDQNSALCSRCRTNPWQAIDGIRAATHFDDTPIRKAIHALKYHNHQALASSLGILLADACRRFNLALDVVVPVPLHTRRMETRGYNQSELLAQAVGDRLRLGVNTGTLKRTRDTKVQVNLTVEERHDNVTNAFSCTDRRLAGQSVLIIDDVCTTGATMDACAMALKESGVLSVWGLALARASVPA